MKFDMPLSNKTKLIFLSHIIITTGFEILQRLQVALLKIYTNGGEDDEVVVRKVLLV